MSALPRFRHLLGPVQLTAVVFFMVSGGPYGLEPVLNQLGPGVSLLLVLLIPMLWSLPTQLMVLELNGMMPRYGGYYHWVKAAMGQAWGFNEGWWSWLFGFVDLAIYPVLFVEYLTFFFPEAALEKHLLCLAVVWLCASVNLLGIVPTGKSSVTLGLGVLFPFLVLFAYALLSSRSPVPSVIHQPFPTLAAFSAGLLTVMWNYLGWDNASPFAEEVKHPVRSYLVSFFISLLLIVALYLLSLLSALRLNIDPDVLEREGFPALGLLAGGPWLGALLALGGMASAAGIYLSSLLYVSRLPKAMADDGVFPRSLGKLQPRTDAPHVSIILCSLGVSAMVLWNLPDLLVIDVTLYGAALLLEFASLILLRLRRPEEPRPFRVPLSTGGLIGMSALPAICLIVALGSLLLTFDAHVGASLFAGAALLSGPLVWVILRHGSRLP